MKKPMIIGLKELRENTETYIKRVQKGESLIVMRRSLAVFRISPPYEDSDDVESEWETVVDLSRLKKGRGAPFGEVADSLSRLKKGE